VTGPEKARRAAVAIALALAAIALRAPHFDLPLERDEGGYAYIAWRMQYGELPYRDWFDQKPPGITLAYRAALALPVDPSVAIRAVAALSAAAAAVAVWALACALLGEAAGAAAAALYVLMSADPMLQGPIANTEVFMVPWIAAAAWLALRAPRGARGSLAADLGVGLALGIASVFKQVAAVNAPFLLAVVWWRAPRADRTRRTVQALAGFAAGGALIWGAIVLWFWHRGAFAPALDAVLLHNLRYSSDLTLAERWAGLRYVVPQLAPTQATAWLVAVVGLVRLWRRSDRFPAVFLTGFAAVNAVGVSASGLYFPHYFQQLLPAVAILAAAALSRAPRAWAVAGFAVAAAPLIFVAASFARLSPEEAMRRIYPGNPFEVMPVVADELTAVTGPDDRVFVFGAEPELLLYARRVSASRYIYLYPVFTAYPDAADRQASVIAELEAHPPAAIVYAPLVSFYGRGRPQHLSDWTTALIDKSYRLRAYVVGEGERVELRRVGPGDDPGAVLAREQPWMAIFVRADGA
jgi:4-amino-4-deoxy-L-arabinose transferase-like glycosyltransferase